MAFDKFQSKFPKSLSSKNRGARPSNWLDLLGLPFAGAKNLLILRKQNSLAKKNTKPVKRKPSRIKVRLGSGDHQESVSFGSTYTGSYKNNQNLKITFAQRTINGLKQILLLIIGLFLQLVKLIWIKSKRFFGRENLFRIASVGIFGALIIHIAGIQVFTDNLASLDQESLTSLQRSLIIPSRRGQIYISDIGRSQNKIPLTSVQILGNLSIDPQELRKVIDNGRPLREIALTLSSNLNISYPQVLQVLEVETNKATPSRYAVIQKEITEKQTQITRDLIARRTDLNSYFRWLRIDDIVRRSYPQGKLLASTIGYLSKYDITAEEAAKTPCNSMVQDNAANGSAQNSYRIGYYGLEQKYCSQLAGRNGKSTFINTGDQSQSQNLIVENGADIYLTIDKNLQQKAEEILEKAIKDNTNQFGAPRNGSISIMDPQTGRILALASYPTFDPNEYDKANPEAFRNVATSEDYEVGSSMKPLTVAAALSEYETGNLGSNGQRLGIPADWAKRDYDKRGKIYKEFSGNELRITNSQGISYDNRINDLKMTIRDSINTMISDITDSLGNTKLREYFEQRFLFGQTTEAAFAGGGSGNVDGLDTNINCQFCYAQHGFGQGFYSSPLQLMRAFTALANKGRLVEPYLIDRIEYGNGTIDDGTGNNSTLAKKTKPTPIISEQSARLVTGYMQAVIDEGYLGQDPKAIPGYSIAAKTGTAQISRPVNGKPCDYDCNTSRGLFDHTLIGYGPTKDPKVMVLVKLSQPKPGQITNFADTTSSPAFLSMMKYTLEYLGVPKDR